MICARDRCQRFTARFQFVLTAEEMGCFNTAIIQSVSFIVATLIAYPSAALGLLILLLSYNLLQPFIRQLDQQRA